jgi:hypothetical protein
MALSISQNFSVSLLVRLSGACGCCLEFRFRLGLLLRAVNAAGSSTARNCVFFCLSADWPTRKLLGLGFDQSHTWYAGIVVNTLLCARRLCLTLLGRWA